MKNKIFILSYILIFIGCSKEKDNLIIDDNNNIQLSLYSLQLLAGDSYVIDVLSDNEKLAVLEENSEIASAWWINNGKSLRIKCENVGNTSIYVRDRLEPDCFAEIKVISEYLDGNFIEEGEKANIVVQAHDRLIANIIENELKELAQKRSGTIYAFDKTTKSFNMDYSQSSIMENDIEGEYEWKIDSLLLKENTSIIEYGFGVRDAKTVFIKLNLLEQYKCRYPESNVVYVKLDLCLSRY